MTRIIAAIGTIANGLHHSGRGPRVSSRESTRSLKSAGGAPAVISRATESIRSSSRSLVMSSSPAYDVAKSPFAQRRSQHSPRLRNPPLDRSEWRCEHRADLLVCIFARLREEKRVFEPRRQREDRAPDPVSELS